MVSKELVVSQNRHETKVAVLEDGQLVEIYLQRANEYSLAGSIHKGRVTRVLPGMQSAFVDLGLERDCFLYVSDFFEENADEIDRLGGEDRGRPRRQPQQNPTLVQQAAPSMPAAAGLEVAPFDATGGGSGEADDAAGRERRGRRRSRRRRGRGFPESKYSSDAAAGAVSESEEAAGDEPELADAGESPAGEDSSELDDFPILPGESLSKYKRAVPPETPSGEVFAEPASLGAAPEELDVTPEEYEQAAEAAAEDAAEALLDRVDEIEERDFLPSGPEIGAEEQEEEEISSGGASGQAGITLSLGEFRLAAEPEEPADASGELPDSEGEPAGQEPDAGAEPDTADLKLQDETAEPEGPEPARMPQSLTATLRAQGGRLPHRISRRSRRRRGGRGAEADLIEPAAPLPAEERQVDLAGLGETVEVSRPAEEAAPAPSRQDRTDADRGRQRRERDRDRERPALPSIAELLKEGQEIIVQIAKEPLGQKGARITSHIALPGRYVVYMPTVDHLGVSRKISTDEERQRLKRILQRHREGIQGGFIMRTAGEGRTEEDIASDMQYLANLWLEIREKAEKRRAPALLHHDVEIVERLLRDQLTEGFKAVWVDNEELYEQVLHAVERLQPALLSRVKLYTRPEPIFEAFGISQELEKALRPKVWLKSGGYIVINQTEALVAIDINTGKYVGKSNKLEDTIVKTNTEAVKEIVRQLRLRDLGGIIVIDFIDMDERKNRQKVMQALEDAMRADKAPYKILQFNDFGLVAITRKRVKQSLERALCSPCPYCEGAGYVKSVQTVIGEILTEAQKYAKVVDTKDVVCRANPEVAKVLKSTENEYLEELEEILGRPVAVVSDPTLHQEKFDLA